MVILKNRQEIDIMATAGKKLAVVLSKLRALVRQGITSDELEQESLKLIYDSGSEPAFLNYKPTGATKSFPASLCVSINDEVVHTPPSSRVLVSGDMVKLDIGIKYHGYYVDAAVTVGVGDISKQSIRLQSTTRDALNRMIELSRPGKRLGDLGAVVSQIVTDAGFSVVRDLTGHGIGRDLHEDPHVFNFGRPGEGLKLKAGMVLALEPIISAGNGRIRQTDQDGYVTADGSLSAHFEHTVAITEEGPRVLTA